MVTINDAFQKFLNEQEASSKSETYLDCEDTFLLYEEFLESNAEDYLSDDDTDLYVSQHEHNSKSYCDILGPEHLTPSEIKDFLEDYVVEEGGGKKFTGIAANVLQKFFEWNLKKGYIEEKAFEANSKVIAKYKKK
jgi:hypothetical protein